MPVTGTAPQKPVSATTLAQHLDCSRTYIGKLEAEGVIQRQGAGFPLDRSRVAYLRFLRRERQQSPRSAADAEHAAAKSELLRLRIARERREAISMEEANEFVDGLMGILLTGLGSLPAQAAGHDLVLRRKLEDVVYELREKIADECEKRADACRPPG